MKKVIGQTVRDLKREVNKKVLKVSGVEQKILDSTSNEPWGPRVSDMIELAQVSRNYNEYQLIMSVLWKRINDTGKNWRHVYKALTVLEYLLIHGHDRVIDEVKEHTYQLSTLADFQYVDSNGKDQGSSIRRKSQGLVALVNNKEKIYEIRRKAQSNREKYNGVPPSGGAYRNSSHTGSHADRYDYGHNARSEYGREREYGYRDDRGYQMRSRSQSVDGYMDRSYDDDDRYSSRSVGAKTDDQSLDDRDYDKTISEHDVGAPPSYEEVTKDMRNTKHERDEENVASPTRQSTSSSKCTGEGPDKSVASDTVVNEFDPRGSVPATPAASGEELDIFGLSAPDSAKSLAPADSNTSFEANMQTSSSLGTNQTSEDPFGFGDEPFKAVPQDNFTSQPQSSFQPSDWNNGSNTHTSTTPNSDPFSTFDFGNALGDNAYAPSDEQSCDDILDSILPRTGFSSYEAQPTTQMNFLPDQPNPFHTSGFAAPEQESQANSETSQINPFQISEQSAPVTSQEAQANSQNLFPPSTASPEENSSQPSESSTPQGPQASTQTSEMNFFEQSGLPDSGSLATPQQSQEITKPAEEPQTSTLSSNLNFFESLEPSPPVSSTSSTSVIENQSAQSPLAHSTVPTNIQTTHSSQYNMQSAQFNLGSQPMQSAQWNLGSPQSMQVYGHQPNMNSTYMNFASQPMQSSPLPSQTTQAAVSSNTQANQPNMNPAFMNLASQQMQSSHLPSQTTQAAASSNTQANHFGAPVNMHTGHSNLGSQATLSDPFASQAGPPTAGALVKSQTQEKFQPKSTVWADTLSRGLVNFNISGPKTNPLDDIGIDFDAINRKEKRLEYKSAAPQVASTITMGKAMGSGSGLGRASAGGIAPPPSPMMAPGMGMGGMGGMGMNGMGMGMNMGGYGGNMMNQAPMGMNMAMNRPMGQRPPNGMMPQGPGMPAGSGYNPMMGMGGYGMQQPYGGGYR